MPRTIKSTTLQVTKMRIPWNKGKHHTDATKQKIREKAIGRHPSEDTRKKLRKRTPWNKGKIGIYSKDAIQKMSIAKAGKSWTERYGNKKSEELKQKMAIKIPWNKGKKGLQISHMKGKHHTIEAKQRNRKKHIELWQTEEYAKKMIKSFQIKPSGPELYLDFLLQNYFPDEWKFVGDGQVIIGGLCPDFININGKKKIIEFFGKYWHGENAPFNRTEGGRKSIFSQFGFHTLIIWDYELIDEEKVIERIRNFSAL